MKKYFMYAGILAVIVFLFFLGNYATSQWEENVKYRNKLGLGSVNPGDLYVVQDSLLKKSFFKIIGITTNSSYCIAYGKDTGILPSDLSQSTILLKKGLLIDEHKNWVAEVLENQDNFNDKLDFLSKNEIDFIFSSNTIHGYDNGQPEMDFIYKLNLQYYFGGPLLLIGLLLGLFIIFYLFDILTKTFIPAKKYTILRLSLIIFVIMIYAFLNGNFMPYSSFYDESWIGYVYVFLSHILVFLAFQNISGRVDRMPFEEKEITKFFSIIVLGIGFEFIFRICFDYLLLNAQNQGRYDVTSMFPVFLVVSFKFWVLIASANFFNNLVKYISSLRRKSRQLQSVTTEAGISAEALQQSEAYVNTHFLYNSLHAIAALAPVSPEKTETLALSLAKYYRYTTNRNDETWITIKEEIEALTAYLEVEKTRMGEKLSYSFDISEDAGNIQIPKFLMQPLVENALKYGYNSNTNLTKITINAITIDDKTLKLMVCDSGQPFGDSMEIGTGIRNVKDQLKRFYPDRHSISFINEPRKCVEIVLTNKNEKV
jgi:hypothetical protein